MKNNKKTKDWKHEVLLNYLGRLCTWCGSLEKLHIHHILPRSNGGQNIMANLEVVCSKCHWKLHSQIEKIIPKKRIFIPVPMECSSCKVTYRPKHKSKSRICSYCTNRRNNNLYQRDIHMTP